MNKLLIFVVLVLFIVVLVQFARISQQKTEINTLQQELAASSNNLDELKMEMEEVNSRPRIRKESEERKVRALLEEYIHEKTNPETTDSYTIANRFIPNLNPVKGSYKLSQRFSREHKALDFAAAIGTEVVASASGKIVTVGYHKYYGEMIILKHNSEYKTLYAHLSKVLVKEGTVVQKGDVIGLVGNSGNSTASHLHFEVMQRGKNIDPAKILKKIE